MLKLPQRWLEIMFLVLIVLGTTFFYFVWQMKVEFFDKPYHQSPKRIVLTPNASSRLLIADMKRVGLVKSPRSLAILFKLYHITPQLKAGTYLLETSDTVWQFLRKMINGKVMLQRLTIVEGMRLCELQQLLTQAQDFRFQSSAFDALENKQSSLEGMFFASTYQYAVGEDIMPVLKLARQELNLRLEDVWQNRDKTLPYRTPYELLIAASIIEKEAADKLERKLISGIIVNRLRLHMPLQMDPIVAYGMPGCAHIILKGTDIKQDSAYNSYKHYGLPPTPIAMVGMDSLLAAAHPTPSQYLYFVAKGNGLHNFSNDYRSQIHAVKQYLRNQHAN